MRLQNPRLRVHYPRSRRISCQIPAWCAQKSCARDVSGYLTLAQITSTSSSFTMPCLVLKRGWPHTRLFKKPDKRARSEPLVFPISTTLLSLMVCHRLTPTSSNIHHLEEIKKAGYELPAVNQIEVRHILPQVSPIDQ